MANDDQVYSLIASERRSLIDVLETLSDAQWQTPSLCEGWTVRHVVGHLASILDLPRRRWVGAIVRHRGFDPAADKFARSYAERPTAALVGILRRNAERRYRPPGLPVEAPLVDVLVHSVDIAVPLGRSTQRSTAAGQVALDYFLSGKSKRARAITGHSGDFTTGLRYVPSDGVWPDGPTDEHRHGLGDLNGLEVSGTGAILAAALSGRLAVFDHLSGAGVGELRSRISA